jgi:ribonuclease Z
VGQLVIGHFSARYDEEEPLLQEAQAIFPHTMLAKENLCIPVQRS